VQVRTVVWAGLGDGTVHVLRISTKRYLELMLSKGKRGSVMTDISVSSGAVGREGSGGSNSRNNSGGTDGSPMHAHHGNSNIAKLYDGSLGAIATTHPLTSRREGRKERRSPPPPRARRSSLSLSDADKLKTAVAAADGMTPVADRLTSWPAHGSAVAAVVAVGTRVFTLSCVGELRAWAAETGLTEGYGLPPFSLSLTDRVAVWRFKWGHGIRDGVSSTEPRDRPKQPQSQPTRRLSISIQQRLRYQNPLVETIR
jgi:hypothetical protein